MVKLIAIDLDGTLLNSRGRISQENLTAIRLAEDYGIKVVLCTGRPYVSMKSFVEEIGFRHPEDYIITFNGGQIQKAADGQVIVSDTLSCEDMFLWNDEMQRLDLPMNLIDQDYVYEPLVYPKHYPSLYTSRKIAVPVKKRNFLTFDRRHLFNKFIIGADQKHLETQKKKIQPALFSNYTLTMSFPWLMEVSNLGVDKGSAVRKLALELNIDQEETMGIGDQLNDLSLIEYTGIGVAMENAVEELKKAADFITKSNDEHGVAHAIHHVLGAV